MPSVCNGDVSFDCAGSVRERTDSGHSRCSCLLHMTAPMSQSAIDQLSPIWNRGTILQLDLFSSSAGSNEAADCTQDLLIPRRKDKGLRGAGNEKEDLWKILR